MRTKLGVLLLLLIFAPSVWSQTATKPTTCELSSGTLDALLDQAGPNDILIVIAHLGAKEFDQKLNTRRLANVEAYVTKYRKSSRFSAAADSLVMAVGRRSRSLGFIELFFRGQLVERLFVGHNKDLFVGECAIDLQVHKGPCEVKAQKVFYPCRR